MGDVLEFITCKKCGIQQPKDTFWQGSARADNCKYCNKKTNIIPPEYNVTAKEISEYLQKIIFDEKNKVSISLELKMDKVFIFLDRLKCKEREAKA